MYKQDVLGTQGAHDLSPNNNLHRKLSIDLCTDCRSVHRSFSVSLQATKLQVVFYNTEHTSWLRSISPARTLESRLVWCTCLPICVVFIVGGQIATMVRGGAIRLLCFVVVIAFFSGLESEE